MINIFILIILALGGLWFPACEESSEENSGDPLKQLQDEGRLPSYGEGRELPILPPDSSVLEGGGPEVLSLYPVEIDRDQDGFPDAPIPNHPEIKIDNCPGLFNPDQQDADGDGLGNVCE